MKIIDTFPFFNELSLLDLRLNILNDYVDEFILVEATRSHQNKTKPLYFNDNKHLFKKYIHKIKHVVIDSFPEHTYWSHENYQRDSIGKHLQDKHADDIIFISDLDEIWNPKALIPLIDNVDFESIYRWQSITCYFYYNLVAWPYNWIQPMFMRYSLLNKLQKQDYKISTDILRGRDHSNKSQPPNRIIEGITGWHFSYMEDPLYKLQNFLHSEYSNMSLEQLQNSIEKNINPFHTHCQMTPVPTKKLKEFLPEYIIENLEKYKSKIIFSS